MKQLILALLILLLFLPILALPRVAYPAMSALVPGSAELVLGKDTRGAIMMGTDLIALLGWSTFKQDVKDYTNSYKRYANIYAGVPLNTSEHQLQHMQNYISSDAFNDYQEMMARNYFLIYDYDLDAYNEYMAHNLYGEDESWQWQSLQHQKEYKKIRRHKQSATQHQRMALGALLFNRAISIVDALIISKEVKTKSLPIYVGINEDNAVMIHYSLEF